jgi:hypothetical protein
MMHSSLDAVKKKRKENDIYMELNMAKVERKRLEKDRPSLLNILRSDDSKKFDNPSPPLVLSENHFANLCGNMRCVEAESEVFFCFCHSH